MEIKFTNPQNVISMLRSEREKRCSAINLHFKNRHSSEYKKYGGADVCKDHVAALRKFDKRTGYQEALAQL